MGRRSGQEVANKAGREAGGWRTGRAADDAADEVADGRPSLPARGAGSCMKNVAVIKWRRTASRSTRINLGEVCRSDVKLDVAG